MTYNIPLIFGVCIIKDEYKWLNNITLIFGECIIKDEYKLVKELNEYYLNIVEKSGATKPVTLGVSGKFKWWWENY